MKNNGFSTSTNGKTLSGKVVSTFSKTCVVEVVEKKQHHKYNKYIVVVKKFQAHDEESRAKLGDAVSIRESRPYSRHKKFELVEIN